MPLESPRLTTKDVFSSGEESEYLTGLKWDTPIQFFVGRNGTGKSKTGRALTRYFGVRSRLVSTDRLVGLMGITNYGYGLGLAESAGVPLKADQISIMREVALTQGLANDVFYILRERPEIYLRIAALYRRAFSRRLHLSERSGFVDPLIEDAWGRTYSLLRDEGHGLRELTALLAYTYEEDRELLVVDEPELHLHPSLVRFLTGRRHR